MTNLRKILINLLKKTEFKKVVTDSCGGISLQWKWEPRTTVTKLIAELDWEKEESLDERIEARRIKSGYPPNTTWE